MRSEWPADYGALLQDLVALPCQSGALLGIFIAVLGPFSTLHDGFLVSSLCLNRKAGVV